MEFRAAGVHVVDLNTPMTMRLKSKRKSDPAFKLSPDGIHPDKLGHLLIASQILRALEIDTGRDGLESLLERVLADPLFALVDERRRTLSDAWLARIGYVREQRVQVPSIGEPLAKAEALQRKIEEELRRS